MHIVIILGCGRGLIKDKDNYHYKITEKSHLYHRIVKAIEVYNSIKDDDKMIICSGGGRGQSESIKNFLLDNKIPLSRIKREYWSRTTIENCIFTYDRLNIFLKNEPTIQQLNGINILDLEKMDNLGIKKLDRIDCFNVKLYVVTNDYHLKRSLDIFQYFIKRISGNCIIKGIAAETPGNNPEWQKKEEKNLNKLTRELSDLKYWVPLPHDYRNRIRN